MDPESIDYLCTTPDKCHNPFVTFTSAKITYCPTDNFLSHVYIDFRCSKVPKVANVICCKSISLPELWSPLIESQLPSTGQHVSFSDTPTASPGNLFASSYQDSDASEGAGNTIVSMKPKGIDGTDDRVTEDITANDFV